MAEGALFLLWASFVAAGCAALMSVVYALQPRLRFAWASRRAAATVTVDSLAGPCTAAFADIGRDRHAECVDGGDVGDRRVGDAFDCAEPCPVQQSV